MGYISFDLMSKQKQDIAFDHLLAYISRAGNGQIKKTMRAKFLVNSVTDFGYGSKQVKMQAVYSNTRGKEDN